jgi:hypothetical protein
MTLGDPVLEEIISILVLADLAVPSGGKTL